MFNGMKKTLFYLALAVLVAGCAQDIELTEPLIAEGDPQTEYQPLTRSLEGAVYNDVVDAWMVPQADPYTLENFQRAYDNLALGKSTQKLSKAQAAEFTPAKKLAPTHYALKIYPKNEEEQWRVETMEDVQVAYIPFDWVQLSHDEVEKLPTSKTLTSSAANTFAEKSPYKVTYVNTHATDGGPTGPVTYQLPILYTVWPVDKPLPTDLEYVIDYEVFLPDAAAQMKGAEALSILEVEAVSAALGVVPIRVMPTTRAPAAVSATLKIRDDILGKNVPLVNLVIQGRSGSNIKETTTDSNGTFSISMSNVGIVSHAAMSLIPVYKSGSGLWMITTDTNIAIPYQGPNINAVPDISILSGKEFILPKGTYQENVIHRAVNYFYNVQNVFPKHYTSGGTKIIAHSGPSTANEGFASGSFGYPSYDIHIYNWEESHANVIGTTLHELGHLQHCRNSTNHYLTVPETFLEAFAAYSGWYLGQNYYASKGASLNLLGSDVVNQARQHWTKGSLSFGSPLFVDLSDSYDQSTLFHNSPKDQIQGVLPSDIWSILTTSTTWPQCRQKIVNLVGTAPYFSMWIEDFDDWFEEPRNNMPL